jgi:hypothetical protein
MLVALMFHEYESWCRAFASLSHAIGRSVLITVANYSLPPASITVLRGRNGVQ